MNELNVPVKVRLIHWTHIYWASTMWKFHGQRSLAGCSSWGRQRVGHNLAQNRTMCHTWWSALGTQLRAVDKRTKNPQWERETGNQIRTTSSTLDSGECSREKAKPWTETEWGEALFWTVVRKGGVWVKTWRGWGPELVVMKGGKSKQREQRECLPWKGSWLQRLGKTSRPVGSREEWAQMGLRDDEGSDPEDPTS